MNTIEKLAANLRQVIHGKDEIIELLLVALCSSGHVLLEDVPGVGKTTLAKTLARSIAGSYHRIQFTPDLLPSDIVGGMIYCPKTGDFNFRAGPIFCNVLLADEINRASPRTQSALLEAMSERHVTIEGSEHRLGDPFLVVATQNPVEYQGTYPLPEAQLDRFAMQLVMGYPSEQHEVEVVLQQRQQHPLTSLEPVISVEDIVALQAKVCNVDVEHTLVQYMTALVRSTRREPRLRLGASPRAALILYRTCQALALLRNRNYVIPDDIQTLAVAVLAHRLVLDTKALYGGVSKAAIIEELLAQLPVPV